MHRQLFKVGGLNDIHRMQMLTSAIQDLPSVTHIDISMESSEVDVEHGNFVSPEEILQAIVDAGFDAEYTAH
ncbi:MAG: heavy-metal-associated domain-containing protein [Dechloromonas sp.]|nr:heavy-metal-associated domain-containing protein [Dechloromonas sp.]